MVLKYLQPDTRIFGRPALLKASVVVVCSLVLKYLQPGTKLSGQLGRDYSLVAVEHRDVRQQACWF